MSSNLYTRMFSFALCYCGNSFQSCLKSKMLHSPYFKKLFRSAWVNGLLNCYPSKDFLKEELSYTFSIPVCFFCHLVFKKGRKRLVAPDTATFALFVSYYPLDDLLCSLSFVVAVTFFVFFLISVYVLRQRAISGRYLFRALGMRTRYL